MKIRIGYYGPWSFKPLKVLAEEYQKRIGRYFPIALSPDAGAAKKPGEYLVALDRRGKTFDSVALAKWLEERAVYSTKSLSFLLGPAEGFLAPELEKADLVLSLSPMTLQHELALVVLLEQIYRACTILRGEKYHK